jgi:hypothetical protein
MMMVPRNSSRFSTSSSRTSLLMEVVASTTLGMVVGAMMTLWIHKKYNDCYHFDTKKKKNETCCTTTTSTQQQDNIQGDNNDDDEQLAVPYEVARRERLPTLVILVRHGESEGNVDRTRWSKIPDNLIRLTPKGIQQAVEVGERIERIFQWYEQSTPQGRGIPMDRVHIHASPFERTIQTSKYARKAFDHRVVRHHICPRLREQGPCQCCCRL